MRHALFMVMSALGILSGTTGAMAGEFVAPLPDPVAAPVMQASPASDWAGGYAGGSLGYSFGGDDRIGFDVYEDNSLIDRNNDLGSADVKGPTVGLQAGYRWQRGNWVFGPELWIEGGSVDGSDTITPDGVRVESSVNYLVGLQLKTGYAVDPQTLVYGTAGAVHGDLDYTLSGPGGSETVNYDADGYTLGLGVERKLRDSVSVVAEWQYRNLGKTEIEYDAGTDSLLTRSTPEHHNIKLGVNFSF